ncbi:MAG: hypothetical protein P0S96_03670 [Simkaniaceae bacterium]|nr:hypothetical protein [Candidatus Sacchlamyda saccharinae]
MKVNLNMPNMQPAKDLAAVAGNKVAAGARETSRVISQTTVATAALVKLVALAVLTAIASPLYFASNSRFEALREKTVEAFQDLKVQTRAIAYNPAKEAPASAPKSRVEAVVAKLQAAASTVKANKGKSAAIAFSAVAGAALYYNGVPAVVTETASRVADYFFPVRVAGRDAEQICQNLAAAGKVCTVAQFEAISEALLSGKGVMSETIGQIVA